MSEVLETELYWKGFRGFHGLNNDREAWTEKVGVL